MLRIAGIVLCLVLPLVCLADGSRELDHVDLEPVAHPGLLDHGADITLRDFRGRTPREGAEAEGHVYADL